MLIGNLGSTRRAEVGSAGLLRLPEGTTIEWWVRSGDRWHVPSTDVTARDWLLDNAPVLSSAVRVPGGDVTGQVYATVQGPREVVSIELANSTPAPLAAALIVRSGSGRPLRIDGTTIFEGDRPVAYLPAVPSDVIAGPLEPLIADSDTNRPAATPSPLSSDTIEAAFVVPLLHRSNVRFAALLGVASALGTASVPVLSALPDPAMVARGWGLQAGNVARIDGDQRRANAMRSLATAMLLYADGTASRPWTERAAIARGLVRIGAHDEAVRALEGIDDAQFRNGSLGDDGNVLSTAEVLAAVVTVGRHLPDALFAHSMIPLVAGALEFLQRSARRDATTVAAHSGVFLASARMLERVNEQRAALTAQQVWSRLGSSWPLARALEPTLPAITSGATLVPGDPQRLSNAVVSSIDALAMETADGSIDVLSGWTADDLAGVPVAVHHVDTAFGAVSAAIRWHGARPALLWDVQCAPADRITVRCSVLDAEWSSNDAVGEALLAAPVVTRREP
jgi:hypothetical protein